DIEGNTIVIGAHYNDIGANLDQGAAYVFTYNGAVWTEQQELNASDGGQGDLFGASVSVNGDTIVVGACCDDIGANTDQGSAYVFTRSGSTWTQQQKLIAAEGSASDFFGESAYILGDTIIVGSSWDDLNGNTDQGSAYVFTRSGSVWSEIRQLTASDGGGQARFGTSVVLDPTRIVVGAPRTWTGTASAGASYIYTIP
ncbi:MAG TPA: FG-GAP repeat protein, partial [Phototrophicaceae bacterium]|nr:FG-GAP repeat protein [Phototrophicaceae bacterium]